jgi:hypothetical protein
LSFNRQSIFDSLGHTLIRSGDVEEVRPNPYTNQFHLVDASIVSTSTLPLTTAPLGTSQDSSRASFSDATLITSAVPVVDYLYQTEQITKKTVLSPIPIQPRGALSQWFSDQITRFGTRGLLIGSIIASCFLLFLIFIFVRLHCTNRRSPRKNLSSKHTESNGKSYAHLHQQSKRSSSPSSDERDSKKHMPRLLRYLHATETKSASFRLSTNDTDSYQLICSMKDNPSLPYRNSDCVLNEHCCIHASLSQPDSSATSMYHQVNRLMASGSDPPLPLPNLSQSHSHLPATGTLRSVRKEFDNSSAQTYSAVYSCELAANLDVEQESMQKRSSVKRRSILKNHHSTLTQTRILFLYTKNLVDCYALQPCQQTNQEPVLLATASENRIQLAHALVSQSSSVVFQCAYR